MTPISKERTAGTRGRRGLGFVGTLAGGLLVCLAVVAGGCINPSLPTDLLLNLPWAPDRHRELDAPEDTLVVLQHGMWRSQGAMWRLERALRKQGYEVLNESYPSTRHSIEAHGERLERRLEAYLEARGGAPPRIAFVGHSMGGLVIRSYLQRADARDPWACVFIGTPQRGATLAELYHERWWYGFLMNEHSALQLVPGDPLYAELEPLDCPRIGVIYGGKGDGLGWNDKIPGDDDGTVGAEEAQLPEQSDALRLRHGHTLLCSASDTIEQTVFFLRYGRFDPEEAP